MNAIELMIFLGHSSTHEPFDEFLTKNSIKSRPKTGRSLETLIPIKGQGLSMSFEIDAKGNGIAPKSEGAFIFSQLEIRISGDDGRNGIYSRHLPYGLSANDSRDAVEKNWDNLSAECRRLIIIFLTELYGQSLSKRINWSSFSLAFLQMAKENMDFASN